MNIVELHKHIIKRNDAGGYPPISDQGVADVIIALKRERDDYAIEGALETYHLTNAFAGSNH